MSNDLEAAVDIGGQLGCAPPLTPAVVLEAVVLPGTV